jgi:hypothetical protein
VDLTRRSFLAVAGASPLALTPGMDSGRDRCVVVSDAAGCLPESAQGYVRTAGDPSAPIAWPVHDPAQYARAATVVVPARLFDRPLAHRLREAAWNGASVLIELGLAFVDEYHARAQRRLISDEFDLTIGDVVRLWDDGRSRVPYVRYLWPLDVWVRDFSYVVAVSGAGWRVIALVETVPVAARRRLGRGSLTMLGSPLGPALRAGDPEAAVWFRRFLHGDDFGHALIG